jgi:hypothetical protein
MLINVRVLQYGWQYRGLLLYAKDASGDKVGNFDTIDRIPLFQFWCANSVIHTSAELKPYLMTFGWTAPPAGTGAVNFTALIKTGVANTGDFWKATPLILSEGTGAVAPQVFFRSTVAGASCDSVCSTCGGTCDATQLLAVNSTAAVDALVAPYSFCAAPYLLRCGVEGAASDGSTSGNGDGLCFYYNSTACAALSMPVATPTCAATIAATAPSAFRVCPVSDACVHAFDMPTACGLCARCAVHQRARDVGVQCWCDDDDSSDDGGTGDRHSGHCHGAGVGRASDDSDDRQRHAAADVDAADDASVVELHAGHARVHVQRWRV